VKYALQHGYVLHPVYAFGENQTFYNAQGLWKARFWLNSLGFPAVVPFGRLLCPLLPNATALHIVVGKAIRLPLIASPTPEQVLVWLFWPLPPFSHKRAAS
jgi:2-acylglycerol O-acyltransferase 2